ncbi:hypothetical protein ACFE04_012780 [Oxalis oulophora]
MVEEEQRIEFPLLDTSSTTLNENLHHQIQNTLRRRKRSLCFLFLFISIVCLVAFRGDSNNNSNNNNNGKKIKVNHEYSDIVESDKGVVAADDGRCSEVGASTLRADGHAVDAAVATALCLGVVNPMASGIGGGAFMVVKNSANSKAQAFDSRESAPSAASQDMYKDNINAKYRGALSMGVPGEISGLHAAWLQHGRLPWMTLFLPAIKLAKDGFIIAPFLGSYLIKYADLIFNDPGLKQVFAPGGKMLKTGDTCYNPKLAESLEAVAEQGPKAFYDGIVGEKLVEDVKRAGGILTMEDLRNYKVDLMDAIAANVMGHTVYGMPPPSSGTLGLSMILNIFDSYDSLNSANGNLGLHRLIEALKHMFAVRMNLGDPNFMNVTVFASEMLSPSYAKLIQQKILDNTTFPPEYYRYRWGQLKDHGTSHFCIVDNDRNAVSMTSTVNYPFGAGILSPSTGIILNDEMGDFSIPTEISPDLLPPSPANFIEPNKRPLSSMTPIIITKDGHFVGAIGGSGGMNIIPAVTQVFINRFVLGMEPLAAVQHPRIYHRLIPNVVTYENWTVIDGDHIELSEESKIFLKARGHELQALAGGAITQLVVQSLENNSNSGWKMRKGLDNVQEFHGTLTAVSDPRKNGRPAAV